MNLKLHLEFKIKFSIYSKLRSKWTIDIKDLRLTDSGNYTCQVFNSYGFINATYDLIVYEEETPFDEMDPLNSTIVAGMNAEFNCKIRSITKPNIKWMKQISKSEYSNYVQQNNVNSVPILASSQVHSMGSDQSAGV